MAGNIKSTFAVAKIQLRAFGRSALWPRTLTSVDLEAAKRMFQESTSH